MGYDDDYYGKGRRRQRPTTGYDGNNTTGEKVDDDCNGTMGDDNDDNDDNDGDVTGDGATGYDDDDDGNRR